MKRRVFFKHIGKGVTGVIAGGSLSTAVPVEHALSTTQKESVKIKIHPLAVSRKEKKNRSYGSR